MQKTLQYLIFCLLLCCNISIYGQYPAPPQPAEYAVDYANLLTADEEQQLEVFLKAAYSRNREKIQLVVVTVPNLAGQNIKEYANGLARSWGIGDAERNDGFLFLIAKEERQARLEVGYGLEEKYPDLLCQEILDLTILPALKDGDYFKGVWEGSQSILVKGGFKLPANGYPNKGWNRSLTIMAILFFSVIFIVIILGVYQALKRPSPAPKVPQKVYQAPLKQGIQRKRKHKHPQKKPKKQQTIKPKASSYPKLEQKKQRPSYSDYADYSDYSDSSFGGGDFGGGGADGFW
ncbi:TPM domain-containing protein [Saprospira sp. CCB-QB6]|uniref:TPM domain-containing protein n=1 Tax=Saprospira sp. CCB-QB6 TaxID=3023936 RepID=UPI0023498D97|nr:TPM domain-containing protein [Saprospira sp. CCB-QB6]WCL82133.1 TPM domain-containing protein [Saprospira sp. CCB-QB6]